MMVSVFQILVIEFCFVLNIDKSKYMSIENKYQNLHLAYIARSTYHIVVFAASCLFCHFSIDVSDFSESAICLIDGNGL